MSKSRLSFSRYSASKRQQRQKQIASATIGGLCALLLGGGWLLKQGILRVPTLGQNTLAQDTQGDQSVLRLVGLSPTQRAAQLEAIALGSPSIVRSRARYLLAVDLLEKKQGEKALRWLKGLEKDYPVLAAQIALKRAQAYQLTGNQAAAQDAWQDLLKNHFDEPAAAEALFALHSKAPEHWEKALFKPQSRPHILESFRQLYSFSQDDPLFWQKALTEFPAYPRTLELIHQRLKKNPRQPELMLILARYSSESPKAIAILDQLVDRYGKAKGDDDRPIIQPSDWEAIARGYWANQQYRLASEAYAKAPQTSLNAYRQARGLQLAERQDDAILVYKALIRNFPNAPESAIALLKLAEASPPEEAESYLDRVIKQFPQRAGKALVAKADVLTILNKPQEAAQARQLLLSRYEDSDAAAQYRWQVAKDKARTGDLKAAIAWAKPILLKNPQSEQARQAGFWVGKWAAKLGRKQEAQATFKQVIARYPQSYYAWRSAVNLGWKVGDFTTVRKLSPSVELPTQRPLLPAGSAALKELYLLGLNQEAWTLWQGEFTNRLHPTVSEQFTDGLIEIGAGNYLTGISQISTLEDRTDPNELAQYQNLKQQQVYWQALYPIPFQKLIKTESQHNHLNPLLVTALIRQESRFQPKIRSQAGAIGLMQIVPRTGASIARNLNLKKYSLDNPDDNIKLGTWLLDEIHDRHSNNSLIAVASYNAGSVTMTKWLRGKSARDADEFVENIPLDETRDYVKQVFGNYWNYSRLYDPKIQEQIAKNISNQSTAMR